MKAYTDLEQSNKLAEILSIKSADMYYHNRIDIPDNFPLPIEWKHGNPLLSQEIPCWSLSALLEVLPARVIKDRCTYWLEIEKDCNKKDDLNSYRIGYNDIENREFDARLMFFENSNLIDCIYDMVLWYHENKSELCG